MTKKPQRPVSRQCLAGRKGYAQQEPKVRDDAAVVVAVMPRKPKKLKGE